MMIKITIEIVKGFAEGIGVGLCMCLVAGLINYVGFWLFPSVIILGLIWDAAIVYQGGRAYGK